MRARRIRRARLALGAGALAILGADIAVTIDAEGRIDLGDWAAQFTILSVALVALVLIIAAALRREPRGWVHVRAAGVTAIGVAAVLHATLLGGRPGASGDLVNAGLHLVVPALTLIEWMLVRSRDRVRWFTPLLGLVFPAVYLAATLVRGSIVDRYPYDFVDPTDLTGPAGYRGLVQSLSTVLVAFLAVGAVVALIGLVRDRFATWRRER